MKNTMIFLLLVLALAAVGLLACVIGAICLSIRDRSLWPGLIVCVGVACGCVAVSFPLRELFRVLDSNSPICVTGNQAKGETK